MCRKGLAPHFDSDDVFLVTEQELDFFHDHFDFPYPFGKYNQRSSVQPRRDGEPGARHLPRGVHLLFHSKVTQALIRAGPTSSCTRWRTCGSATSSPWVVGRPVAQGVLRRLHRRRRAGRGDPLRGHAGAARQSPQGLGVPCRPAALHPPSRPTSVTSRTPSSTSTGSRCAKGASVLKQLVAYVGQDAFLEGARPLLQAERVRQHTPRRSAVGAGGDQRARSGHLVSGPGSGSAGVNSLTPQVMLSAEGRVTELAVLEAQRISTPNSARTASRWVCTGVRTPTAPWCGTRAPRSTSSAPVRWSRSWSAWTPSWSSSTTTTSRTARSASTRTRWPRCARGSATSPTRSAARCAGRRCGTSPGTR